MAFLVFVSKFDDARAGVCSPFKKGMHRRQNVPLAFDLRNSVYNCVQDLYVYLELMVSHKVNTNGA